MKITIVSNTGFKTKRDLPTDWAEISFQQFLTLHRNSWTVFSHTAEIIALFTGIEVELLKKSKVEGLVEVVQMLSFLDSKPIAYEIPKKIIVNGHHYDVPDNLEMESVAQFEDIKKEASLFSPDPKDKFTNLEKWPLIVATYLVNPYSWQAAEKLAPQVFNSPCSEVLAIGNFTLVRLNELSQNIKPTSLKAATQTSKLKLAMRAFRANMVFSARWFLWKRRLTKAGLNS